MSLGVPIKSRMKLGDFHVFKSDPRSADAMLRCVSPELDLLIPIDDGKTLIVWKKFPVTLLDDKTANREVV